MKILISILLILCVSIFARLPLLDVPLDRDEGEYAYIAQQMIRGQVPYKDAFDQKPPGIFAIYWIAFFLFGQSISGIHIMLLFFIFIGAIFLFLIGRQLNKNFVGMVAAIIYCLLSSSMAFQASSANAEQFMNPILIISVFFLISALKKNRMGYLFLSGLFGGIAFLIKQPAVVNMLFLTFAVCAGVLYKRDRLTSLLWKPGILFAGFFVPIILSVVIFKFSGALNDYLFCAYTYNVSYSTATGLDIAIKSFILNFRNIFLVALPLFVVCFISLLYKRKDKGILLCLLWFIFSFLGASIGLIFRKHYFLQIVPPLALFFAYGLEHLLRKFSLSKRITYYAISGILLIPLIADDIANYQKPPQALSKRYFGYMNPFVESVKVGEYIKKHTSPGDKILVIGSEPQIYFYARREAATKYMFFYPLFIKSNEALRMQKEAMEEIRRGKPSYIININEYYSLLIREGCPLYIMQELNNLVQTGYGPVGCVVVSEGRVSKYYFGREFDNVKSGFPDITNLSLSDRKPKITIFKRR